jgi:hypothetical protein
MNRKALMLSAILGTTLTACVVYLILPLSLKLVYVLDVAHLAVILPEGTFANMTCPYDGSTLTRIVIIQEEGADFPWRAAYVCETESIFWIADYRGAVGKIPWYGPFETSWNKTNLLATIGAVISGTFLIAVLATHYTSKQPNVKT